MEMSSTGSAAELSNTGPGGYSAVSKHDNGYKGAKWAGGEAQKAELSATRERPVYEMSGEGNPAEVSGHTVTRQ